MSSSAIPKTQKEIQNGDNMYNILYIYIYIYMVVRTQNYLRHVLKIARIMLRIPNSITGIISFLCFDHVTIGTMI